MSWRETIDEFVRDVHPSMWFFAAAVLIAILWHFVAAWFPGAIPEPVDLF